MFVVFAILLRTNISFFRGNWTINTKIHNTNYTDSAKVRISLKPAGKIRGLNIVQADAFFDNSTYFKFNKVLEFTGFTSSDNSSLYLFNVHPNIVLPPVKIAEVLRTVLDSKNLAEPYDYIEIHRAIKEVFQYIVPLIDVNSLVFRVVHNQRISSFNPGYGYTGLFIDNRIGIHISLSFFDLLAFNREGKVFALVFSLIIIINFYTWKYASRKCQTAATLSQLSPYSFMCFMSFDFVIALYLFDFSSLISEMYTLFLFLFSCFLWIYFEMQISFLVSIWRENVINNDHITADEIRDSSLMFFVVVSLIMGMSSLSITYIHKYPFMSLLFLYSSFWPQIVHSATQHNWFSNDITLMGLIALSKSVPLLYFTLYPNNVEENYSLITFILCEAYILFQILVLFMQNKYGGAFFLPNRFQATSFDYGRAVVEPGIECAICMTQVLDGDATMTTPCGHSFHRECLIRWMSEDLVCPMCRSQLPPVSRDFLL